MLRRRRALSELWRSPVEPIRHSAVISGAEWIQEEGRGVKEGRKEGRKTDESGRGVSRFDGWRGELKNKGRIGEV